MRLTITDAARYAALLAAMLISYSVEQDLAATHGVPHAVTFAVPVAIDLFMIWAVRTRRDIALAVAVAVLANVAGVLTTGNLHDVSVWVSVCLHAAFPLIVWRMHRTPHGHAEPSARPVMAAEASDSGNGPQNGAPAVPDAVWTEFDRVAKLPAVPEPVRPDMSAVREAVAELSAHGRVTGKALADRLGVSDRTARRYLATMAAA